MGWDGGDSPNKGAFQLHWKQFPAERTFILRHCLARRDCAAERQESGNHLSLFLIHCINPVLIFEHPASVQSDGQRCLG